MKTIVFKAFAIFFILLVATSVMMDVMNTKFGTVNFFHKHGVFFLIFITFFPRLTLLFSSVTFGGFFWWLGFFICPRILVASLATVSYFHTNPVLVIVAWIVALGGETAEKAGLTGRNKFVFRYHRGGGAAPADDFTHTPKHEALHNDDAIEAEFTKKS